MRLYFYLAILLIFVGMGFEIRSLNGKITKLNVEKGQLQQSNAAFVIANQGLQGNIKSCGDSISELKKAGEALSEKIRVSQIAARQRATPFIQRSQDIILRPAVGITECDRAKDEMTSYLEGILK